MNGSVKINDLVSHGSETYIVTNIYDDEFKHPTWKRTLNLSRVPSGGGLYAVPEDKVDVIMTAKWYDANRKTPSDLPDPRLAKF